MAGLGGTPFTSGAIATLFGEDAGGNGVSQAVKAMLRNLGVPYTLPSGTGTGPVTFSNTTAKQTFATIILPGLEIGPKGRVWLVSNWSMTGSANAKTFRAELAGNVMNTVAISTATSIAVQLLTRFANQNSNSLQVTQPGASPGFNSSTTDVVSLTVDTSVDQPLLLTGQMASATESITLREWQTIIFPGV